MSNETLAKAALHHARTACVNKSGNKWHVNDAAKQARTIKSNHRIVMLRGELQQGALGNFSDYGNVCEAEGVGNCTEMALVAQNYVVRNGGDAFCIALSPPGDHVFAVVGFQRGDEALSMADWDEDSYICDPWANIACKPSQYELFWKVKMRKWRLDGKQIASGPHKFEPTSEPWLSSVAKPPYEVLW